VRGLDILKLQLFVLHNTDTISFPLFSTRFLRYNKQQKLKNIRGGLTCLSTSRVSRVRELEGAYHRGEYRTPGISCLQVTLIYSPTVFRKHPIRDSDAPRFNLGPSESLVGFLTLRGSTSGVVCVHSVGLGS
jgi:hypothetical protein